MENLASVRAVKDLCTRYGFSFSKSMGQNFLIDPTVCPRIAELGNARPGVGVLEIGTGFGVLTRELCARADKVVAIELDRSLEPVLAETLSDYDNYKIVWEDVLKVDLPALLAEEFAGMEVSVCANLPYYITSPVIMSLLEQRLPLRSITVMVQREAATRLCAKPGTRECGAVTLAVAYYSQPKLLFQVPRGCFYPSPNVDSSVIRLDLRETPPAPVEDEAFLFSVIRAAFTERRKVLANPVSARLHLPKEAVTAALREAGCPETARAEALTLEQFIRLSNLLRAMR